MPASAQFVHRPTLGGTRHMVSAGHYLAAQAGFAILEAGGNAFDAGVAAGLALGVVQSDIVNVAGVAPILVHLAASKRTYSVSGLGWFPAALRPGQFLHDHGGHIPRGLLRTVVPAAPDAWIQVLERWGTMSFGEVAAAAIRFARDGFVLHGLMADIIAAHRDEYAEWPSNAEIYLPGGQPPPEGARFVQSDLGASLQYMADEEASYVPRGRVAGLAAARDAFYRGDIARKIVQYHEENGGLLTMQDLASYAAFVEAPPSTRFGQATVFSGGPWCQGPALLLMLNMAQALGIGRYGHNSPDYIHACTELLKLGFADREAHIGDPRFHDVPLDRLISPSYASERVAAIDMARAHPGLPKPGIAAPGAASPAYAVAGTPAPSLDTSYVCVVDRWGNAFSATPSDSSYDTPVIPSTGLCPSSRGSQGWADPAHPASALPRKRPRLTPSPAFALFDDGRMMPFGTPGGDVQVQAMLQVFLNRVVFGMSVQQAIEAPRFATYAFPDSFEPHASLPNRLCMESRIGPEVGNELAARGHGVVDWGAWTWTAGAVCLIEADPASGILLAGADPRRASYAAGW